MPVSVSVPAPCLVRRPEPVIRPAMVVLVASPTVRFDVPSIWMSWPVAVVEGVEDDRLRGVGARDADVAGAGQRDRFRVRPAVDHDGPAVRHRRQRGGDRGEGVDAEQRRLVAGGAQVGVGDGVPPLPLKLSSTYTVVGVAASNSTRSLPSPPV